MATRRQFLAASASAAASLALTRCGATPRPPEPRSAPPTPATAAPAPPASAPTDLAEVALDAAMAAGATYADVRSVSLERESLSTREKRVQRLSADSTSGLGVRVVVGGHFGFAAFAATSRDEAAALGRRAVELARSTGGAKHEPIELAPTPRVVAEWASPCEVDPFSIPLERKIEVALAANAAALEVKGCSFASSSLNFVRERRLYFNSEGSRILQNSTRGLVTVSATAVDRAAGRFEPVGIEEPAQMGWEIVDRMGLTAMARDAAESAVRRMGAKSVEAGSYDLILLPSHLWLTIHESIGHPTELDRARGLEANYFGTSFLVPSMRGKARVASNAVRLVADRTQKTALATTGYDDDGVPATEWDIVRDGIFVNYQTTREQARWVGDRASFGCSFGEDWRNISFQRMPNVSLAPGEKPLSLDELVADTKRGILISGDASYSIDQQRRNFQFTGISFTAIRDGKLEEALRDVAYQANTAEFWGSCDAVCDKRFYELHGSFFDAKGQPTQSNPVSHGSAPARFRNVRVLNTKA